MKNIDICSKCGETGNFQFTFDYSKAHRPVINILCNNCGELFPPALKLPKKEPKQEYEYIGECKGNNGNGCFMDNPAHNCGCFVRKPKQETTSLEEAAEILYPYDGVNEDYTIDSKRWSFTSGAKWQQEQDELGKLPKRFEHEHDKQYQLRCYTWLDNKF